MTPIISAFNSKSTDSGREKKNDSDLADGGNITRDYESNENR